LAETGLTRHFLGIPEPAFRLLLAGTTGAIWLLVWWHVPLWANDCSLYLQNPQNFTGNMRGLIEDCMRTGYAQAVTTIILGGIGGAVIVKGVGPILKGRDAGFTLPPDDPNQPTQHCGYCRTAMPPGATKCPNPECGKEKATCRHCGKRLWSVDPNPLCADCTKAKQHCGYCRAEMPPGATKCPNPECGKEKATCRHCGKRLWSVDPNPLCADCTKAKQHCGYCGTEMPPGATKCPNPACGKDKATCPKCGKRFWATDPNAVCPSCSLTKPTPGPGTTTPEPPDDEAEDDPEDEPEDQPTGKADPPAQVACPRCGRELDPAAMTDGRCPACGARTPTPDGTGGGVSKGGKEGGTGASTEAGGEAGKDGAQTGVTGPGGTQDPSTPLVAGATTPTAATGSSAAATPPPPPPDPPFTNQGTVSGNRAAELLEQAGLGKVTRDAQGSVIKVEEAFPGAFTELGGKTVTLEGGKTTGGGLGEDFVEVSKGKITGIGVGPDGKVAVVVNHSDPEWVSRPPTAREIIDHVTQKATDAANAASQAVSDTAKSVEKAYEGLKQKMEQADFARNMYNITKFTSSPAEAEKLLREHAVKNGIDPDQVMQIVKLDKNIWEALKAGIKLPDTLRGK